MTAAVRLYTARRAADIGANLTDGMFEGKYMGKEYHRPDLSQVLDRAWSAGDTHCQMYPQCGYMLRFSN